MRRKRYTQPKRRRPRNFRGIYIEMGWGAREHYRTTTRQVAKWIEECGGDELRAEREAFAGGRAKPRPHLRAAHRKARENGEVNEPQ
ncbi:hypothetical protein [Erythrobacter rubeus]|uniref:Uncharacterized protein n=1 Tax=Erythrobacter rubeus TaxID=2760803 RepID=A0ABR8KKG7_9SPHN|nr:hypothetical protein [Erythrobacter rubeus]MBD2840771.1 hypothetical protein [Erythrobacter rubeus]